MNKDELRSICREQESLLEEARQALSGYMTALAERENEIGRLNAVAKGQAESLSSLENENKQLRRELEEADSTWRAEFENLSAGYQSSMATLNKYWSENFSALETSLRQFVETELSNMAARLQREDPNEYERMLTDWLMGFLADLEDSLQRPPA